MFYCRDLGELPEGGYCFGNKTYIRDQLRELVDADILVMDARKVGMNVAAGACVILYQGRNITAALTEALMRENLLKISESGDLLFCSGKQSKDWDIWELEAKDGYLELKAASLEAEGDYSGMSEKMWNLLKEMKMNSILRSMMLIWREREPRFSIFMIERESIIIILHIV